MEQVKTLDLKGLSHDEKHSLIFPALDGLKEGDVLKVSFDFNPLPLIYMLKAQPELQVAEEKGGPGEWILRIAKTGKKTASKKTDNAASTKEELRMLLRDLKGGSNDETVKARAKKLLEKIDAKTLGILEQELIREGISHEEIRKSLCDIHLEAMRDTLVAKRIEVSPPHPIHTFMEEHKVIVDTLHRLKALVERLGAISGYEEIGGDLSELKDVAHHLVEAESHHQREEEALFPRLEKHDITEPPSIMKEEHVEFLQRKRSLYKIANSETAIPFENFKKDVIELGGYLSKELESHIFKEDNILYQIALQVFTEEDWKEVKRDCDKIGYCCFKPEDKCTTVNEKS